MARLKTTEIKEWREATLAKQGGKCALCCLPVKPAEAVADHCHTSGVMRAVLHRSCNALLGKIENNYARYGVKSPVQLAKMLSNTVSYLACYASHLTADLPLHPTFRTDDEKRELRNKRARKARAAKKDA